VVALLAYSGTGASDFVENHINKNKTNDSISRQAVQVQGIVIARRIVPQEAEHVLQNPEEAA
jgi:hypothetical protein